MAVSHEEQTSWYYPWAWYGSTSSSTSPTAATGPPEDSAEEKALVDPKPAEVAAVPDAVLADMPPSAAEHTLSDPTPPPSPKLHPTTSSPSLDSNPIGDSINSNRTGWVSFFSSSATLGYASRKTITSGEPEVMEIDLDDGAEGETPTAAAAAPPQTASQSEATDKNKKESDGKQTKEAEQPQSNVQVVNNPASSINNKRATSPAPSVASKASTGTKTPAKAPSIAPPRSPTPNLVLPTWKDTFHTPPRSVVPQRLLDGNARAVGRAVMEKTMRFVSGVLFASDGSTTTRRSRSASGAKGKGKEREEREREKRFEEWGLGLPRAWDVLKPAARRGTESGERNVEDVLRGCRHVVVIGIHGWFPGAVIQSVLGEPTGTSTKFVNMMVTALEEFQSSYNVSLDKITRIPLEGEGTINRRVDKLYTALTSNAEWMADLHSADVIFVATHSQGSIVSTHLLDRLIREGHIRTGGSDVSQNPERPPALARSSTDSSLPRPPPQRVCCLALCGIHLGPLRYLSSSSLVLPYIQYFESIAARELFEFQNTESEVSQAYVRALQNVVDNGTKMVYVASLNDQVVPIYSGLFTAASHPLILRSLYIDGQNSCHLSSSSDFLSNLFVLLIRVMNAGLPDSGLLNHLSEATAGSLNGVGHSTVYEEIANYTLAVKYLFLTNSGFDTHLKLTVESFNANTEQNDYEIPWSLRDLIADERIAHFFSKEISQLATAFRQWQPKTTILRDIKRKLQPIQRLPPSFTGSATNSPSPASVSKL
ncbi:hypothetical protein DFH07DRAFT_727794 [Mycena maculata]|uniref:YMC020W-like alpha/beta hydrolase domain-containing protein n=1 Tax=Mycena maculata TaxID=230809 RepID=A0AAD7KDS2_9AGAR|nr:hypothetical protein DFH07DRAFT_727794 [Mycena maculata]